MLQDDVQRELAWRRTQVLALEDLLRVHSLDSLPRILARALPCDNLAIFQAEPDGLVAVAGWGPRQESLREGRLAGVSEPLVERAWASGSFVSRPPERFFDDAFGLAVPLEKEGVLYLGRSREFTSEERSLLASLAGACAALLARFRQAHDERSELERLRAAAQELTRMVERLGSLAEASRRLAQGLDRQALLEKLAQSLPDLPGCIVLGGRAEIEWGERLDPTGLQDLVGAVQRAGRPLLMESFSSLRFSASLGVPLADGAIVLATEDPELLGQHQLELVTATACFAEVALANAALHNQIVEARARMVESGKMAALGQLAAGVAHELNTPLGAVRLALEGAERRPELAPKKVASALEGVLRMQDIVSQLLVYCRPDRSRGRADLGRVVAGTLTLLKPMFSGVEIETRLEAVPECHGTETELGQVVTNLLTNARLAGGPVVVTVRPEDGAVVLEVDDGGPGVPPELRERIFEPFFTTREPGRGTGLGLSISRELVTGLGGSLAVGEAPGGGARFTARIPLA